ncbi:hypothetical protein OG851_41970 (plasmid) [Streptomyces sp. NBC_00161]|uniref:hypothetical protein n=1 Tax=Streptomyces sp. NBC_00161 TaxID=2975671 RepID=UPI00324A494B
MARPTRSPLPKATAPRPISPSVFPPASATPTPALAAEMEYWTAERMVQAAALDTERGTGSAPGASAPGPSALRPPHCR